MLDLSTVDVTVQPLDLLAQLRASDPEPPRCDQPGHGDPEKNRRTCDPCRLWVNWRERDYRRQNKAGISRWHDDIPQLQAHVDTLERAGMVIPDIARAAGLDPDVLWNLRNGKPRQVRTDNAQRILSVPVPERRYQIVPNIRGDRRRRVDATGTHRRMRCAQRAGHSVTKQAAMLGWARSTVEGWFHSSTVLIDVADDVALLYPRLIAQPGDCPAAAGRAAKRGWPTARYFSEANIDDPSYDPFRMIRRLYGVQRRLRALAVIGQGPAQVAARIDEPTETVRGWMLGRPAPAYALHLVIEDYERSCSTMGPDQEAADLARDMVWASPLAWDDVDIDSPTAQPRRGVPSGTPASSLVLYTMVLNALDGKATRADLMSAELEQVVTILHRRRWSDRRIGAWLRWNPDGDYDKGLDAVKTFRRNHGITGYGPLESGASDDAVDGLIVVPAAA